MVRSELLRATSLHAEVAYLRDLKKVGDAKRIADQHGAVLQEQERRFWAEAIKGKAPLRATPSPHVGTPQADHARVQLERMHRAHSELQEAHQTHQKAVQSLQEGLVSLSGSKKKIEVLEKLLAKAQRLQANRNESRFSDEVADLVNTSQAVLNVRVTRSIEGEATPRLVAGEICEPIRLAADTVCAATPVSTAATCVSPASLQPIPLHPTPHTLPPIQFTPPATATTRCEPITISHLSYSTTGRQPQLSLSCSLGSRGTVGLQILRSESGGLKVFIDPTMSTVSSGVIRDKLSIQARLQAVGIKVNSIEIAPADDTTGTAKGTKRARLHEDEDEDAIS